MPLSVAFQLCRTFKPRLVHLVSWSELQKPDSFSPLRWWKWKAMPFIAVMLLQISLCANCTGFPRLILPSEAIQGWIQCYFNVLHAGSRKILNEIDLLLFNFSMFCAKKVFRFFMFCNGSQGSQYVLLRMAWQWCSFFSSMSQLPCLWSAGMEGTHMAASLSEKRRGMK